MQFDILPNNPLRPINWRWLRAGQLADGALISRQHDDQWTKMAGQFRRRQLAATTPLAMQQLMSNRRLSDVFMATTLATETAPAYVSMRAELEARILATEDNYALSDRLGLRVGAIEAYCQLFFDVRARLPRKSFILHFVIGHSGAHQVNPSQYATLWKLFGYFGGPQHLDVLITGFEGHDSLIGLTASEAMDTMISARQRQKMMIATSTLPINIATQQIIFESWGKLRQHERESQTSVAQRNTILTNIEVMLDDVSPFCVGKDVTKHTKLVARYEGAAELRGDELTHLSLGHELTTTQVELLNDMTFPEPLK